ncbi:MAG: energy-coupling factor transporter transmembrane protein EcfT [Clostridiales bacterium]|nr:energy-coupling factor transporter transmembrane protein EcfT [Clostridiales bacterium]
MWREKLRIRKSNQIQALHPSTKFLIVCLFSACSLILGSIKMNGYALLIIPWFLIVPLLCAASGIFMKFCKAFAKVLLVATMIFLTQSFLVRSDVVAWSGGVLKIYEKGLQTGIFISFTILNIAGIFTWMFQTTRNKEISRALEDSGMHHKAAYVFMSTLQMIQVMGQNSKTIMNAQRARGVETEGGIFVRAKAFFPSLVPLILGSIIGAEERALTLESKGFDVNGKKTHMFELEPSGYEKLAASIAVAATAAVLIGRILVWVL